MNPRGLLAAVVVLAGLGGWVWWSNKHPETDTKTTTAAAPKILSVPENQIDEIRIVKSGAAPIVMAKLANKWEITSPKPMPADQDAVNSMTSTVATLTADRLIDEHPSSLTGFGLDKPTEELDIKHKNGKQDKLLFGSDTPTGGNIYAKLESSPKVYTLPSYAKTNFDKSLNDLRDKRLLSFNSDKITSIALTAKNQTVEFGKNAQGEWQITKPRPYRADNMQVDDLVRKLKDAKMELTNPDDPSKSFATAAKVATVSVTDNSGTQTLEIRKGADKKFFARSSAVEGLYQLAGDLGDGLDKTADDFRNRKLFDFGFSDPTRIEINGTAYTRSGEKWTSGSAQYDPASIQGVIDKLRDLAASKFAEKPAGTQTLSIGVTYGDNKRTEKVNILKSADTYDAQRDGEPGVYVLDNKNVDDLQKAISGIKVASNKKKK